MEQNAAEMSTSNLETKNIIINLLKTCEFEASNNMLQIPLEDFEDRVSYYTGIPKITLHQILGTSAVNPAVYPKTTFIDFNTHLIILKLLSKFYERKEQPTFQLLFKNVKEVISFKALDAKQFKQNISILGIDYQTIFNDKKLLMEDPKISFERYSYLKKIRKIRQQDSYIIYYISERIIDKNCNFNNPWKQNGVASDICSGDCILFHAISKSGFTNGLFCFSATEDDFYKWVVDILLGSLYPSSVVVFDNSPLHGRPKSQSLTMFDTKDEMKKWLRKNNVPCSDAMNKSQLYQLVKNHATIEEMPRVDQVLKANGHQVLRLPTHFEDLSPIDHIWQDIKRNLENTTELHDEILTSFENIPKHTYALYETDITERENAMFLLDTEMENVLENFLLDLKNTTSGSAL